MNFGTYLRVQAQLFDATMSIAWIALLQVRIQSARSLSTGFEAKTESPFSGAIGRFRRPEVELECDPSEVLADRACW